MDKLQVRPSEMPWYRVRWNHFAWSTSSPYKSSGIFRTNDTVRLITLSASRGGNDRNSLLGLSIVSKLFRLDMFDVPLALKNRVPHPNKLCNNAQNIQMRPVSEQEVP